MPARDELARQAELGRDRAPALEDDEEEPARRPPVICGHGHGALSFL